MALRNIREDGDPILRKKARPVTDFNDRLFDLLDDMAETMYAADGVGLAAPQVGVSKRIVVIDVGEGLYELINPVIVKREGKVVKKPAAAAPCSHRYKPEQPHSSLLFFLTAGQRSAISS